MKKIKWFLGFLFKRNNYHHLDQYLLERQYTPTKQQKNAGFVGHQVICLKNYTVSYTSKYGIVRVSHRRFPEDTFTFNAFEDTNIKLIPLKKEEI